MNTKLNFKIRFVKLQNAVLFQVIEMQDSLPNRETADYNVEKSNIAYFGTTYFCLCRNKIYIRENLNKKEMELYINNVIQKLKQYNIDISEGNPTVRILDNNYVEFLQIEK